MSTKSMDEESCVSGISKDDSEDCNRARYQLTHYVLIVVMRMLNENKLNTKTDHTFIENRQTNVSLDVMN